MEECESVFKILTGKLTGKRPLGRPRRRSEDDIKMNLKEIGISMRNWAQHRDCIEPPCFISHGVSL